MTEEKLKLIIKGCKKQDRTSQKALYEAYYGFAMAICLRYAGNKYEASEILNDGFFKVLSNIHKYNPQKSFKPWIGKIMTNASIDYYRSNLKMSQTVDLEKAGSFTDSKAIVGKLSYQDIQAFIQRLTPAYRTVFNLYAIDGYTHKEISNILEISEGTSKSNLYKARQKLQEMIQKEAKLIELKQKEFFR
jgi:RNA polymerase sigma factor (sigma-70 family)